MTTATTQTQTQIEESSSLSHSSSSSPTNNNSKKPHHQTPPPITSLSSPPRKSHSVPALLFSSPSSNNFERKGSLNSSLHSPHDNNSLLGSPSSSSPARTPIPKTSVDPEEWLHFLDQGQELEGDEIDNGEEIDDGDGEKGNDDDDDDEDDDVGISSSAERDEHSTSDSVSSSYDDDSDSSSNDDSSDSSSSDDDSEMDRIFARNDESNNDKKSSKDVVNNNEGVEGNIIVSKNNQRTRIKKGKVRVEVMEIEGRINTLSYQPIQKSKKMTTQTSSSSHDNLPTLPDLNRVDDANDGGLSKDAVPNNVNENGNKSPMILVPPQKAILSSCPSERYYAQNKNTTGTTTSSTTSADQQLRDDEINQNNARGNNNNVEQGALDRSVPPCQEKVAFGGWQKVPSRRRTVDAVDVVQNYQRKSSKDSSSWKDSDKANTNHAGTAPVTKATLPSRRHSVENISRSLSEEVDSARWVRLGLMSQRSRKFYQKQRSRDSTTSNSENNYDGSSDSGSDKDFFEEGEGPTKSQQRLSQAMKSKNCSAGEIRSAKRGIMSKQSMAIYGARALDIKTLIGVDKDNAVTKEKGEKKLARKNNLPLRSSRSSDTDNDDTRTERVARRSSDDTSTLQSSSKFVEDLNILEDTFRNSLILPPEPTSEDILTEGQYYLSISMLVYMYSHLRETCRMGHTRVKFEDIDVNSFQSQYGIMAQDAMDGKYLTNTKTAGSIIRVVIDELDHANENEQEQELMGAHREYEKSMMKEFLKWINDSKVNQLDADTEKMLLSLRKKLARDRWKRAQRAISASNMMARLKGEKINLKKKETPNASTEQMVAHLRRQVARYRWKRAIAKVLVGVRLSHPYVPIYDGLEQEPALQRGDNRFVNMKEFVDDALEKQPRYFREGSVMNNLIESGIEVVWFSDLTQSDVVYGIMCNRQQKKVNVVFRGTVNSHNWLMNMKYCMTKLLNPIKEKYPGKNDVLDLHTGFSLYMTRRRKDTGLSKVQEIFEKVDAIGREMAPDGDYNLGITGHSLGGALATLLGFYAASSEQFAHLKTVRVFTYAAPRVGASSFLHAYQHLERTGKIRHARFSCTNDLVPLVPFCNFDGFQPWKWQYYKHVGMRVQLHGVGRVGKWRLQRALDVTYPHQHDWISEIKRVLKNSIFANLNTLAGFKRNHTPTELQKRLHFASQYRAVLGSTVFFNDQKRCHIKNLDEYYCIRAEIGNGSIATIRSIATNVPEKDKKRNHYIKLFVLRLAGFFFIVIVVVFHTPTDYFFSKSSTTVGGSPNEYSRPVTFSGNAIENNVSIEMQHDYECDEVKENIALLGEFTSAIDVADVDEVDDSEQNSPGSAEGDEGEVIDETTAPLTKDTALENAIFLKETAAEIQWDRLFPAIHAAFYAFVRVNGSPLVACAFFCRNKHVATGTEQVGKNYTAAIHHINEIATTRARNMMSKHQERFELHKISFKTSEEPKLSH